MRMSGTRSMRGLPARVVAAPLIILALALGVSGGARAQSASLDRLAGLPGVDAYLAMQTRLRAGSPVVSGALRVTWSPDSQSFSYVKDGKTRRFDTASMTEAIVADAPPAAVPAAASAAGTAPRGPGPCPP